MIPLKLELKNFLSYGEQVQTIDFKDYSLLCLSGKNGNGKSALLDAMTWAVWGQARKISGTIKPDAGLLRLGQTQMMVSFEFEFSGNIYRVRREFAKTYGKPYAALDLELFNSENKKFISLTDKTIRLTQEKIEKLLGLDYETYINSAFLKQGQANEFSQKTPKERKQILANILGLSRYDELQRFALEQIKNYQDEKKLLLGLQEQVNKELEREKDILSEQDKQQKSLGIIKKEGLSLQKDLHSKEKIRDVFLRQKQECLGLLKEQKDLDNKFDLSLQSSKKLIHEWKTVHYKSLHLPSVEKLEQERDSLIKQEKEYLVLQQKNLALHESILQKKDLYQKKVNILQSKKEKEIYEKRLETERNELLSRQVLDLISQKEKTKNELENKLAVADKELLNIKNNLKEQKVFEETLEQAKAQFEKRRSFYQVLIQKGNWVKAQLTEFEQKDKKLLEQKSPSCPLCEQVLTIKRKQFLGSKFKKDSYFLNYRLNKISGLIKSLKKILLLQNEEMKKLLEKDAFYKKLKVQQEELDKVNIQSEQELKIVKKAISELKLQESKALKNLTESKKDLIKLEKNLSKELEEEIEIKILKTDIASLEQQRSKLKYDKKLHIELQSNLSKRDKSLKELESLKQELALQKEKRNKINLLNNELKALKKLAFELKDKIKQLSFDAKKEKELEQNLTEIKKQIEQKLTEREKILHSVGSLENELKRIEKLKEDNKQKQKRLSFLNDEIEEYQLLAQAFGKNGIQALLIEESIPQIEEEANNILAKLTDNQSQVFIESLRDLKSGGVKETLDIQISDTAGIRPYEMFSGGEAFRVDFALRIAISKLLARRAGTALQTLIIDEGFGSQDEEGLGRLMEAIYAIQKDFSKIIVVSHLTNFKDNFPVHFIVDKNTTGSFIRVEERG